MGLINFWNIKLNTHKWTLWFLQLLVQKWFCTYDKYLSDELAIFSLFGDTIPFDIYKINITLAVKPCKNTEFKAIKSRICKTKMNPIIQKKPD